jgi:hypothetical protein
MKSFPLKTRGRPADAASMDQISGAPLFDAASVAVEVKGREQMKALQEGMIRLIEGAMTVPPAQLPPNATFSTYV